ncbi:MAG: hypothetical protein IJZ90_03230 [Clostridia bacterium]|nr:hypothetical protein [Clostridia bacterium]
MVTFKAAVASCPRKSGNHNGDNFYFNSKFITEELASSQVMLAHKKGQSGVQMYAVSDGSMAENYRDEISLMLVRGLKKYHAHLIEDADAYAADVIENYNKDAYSAAKKRSISNEQHPYASLALMYINGESIVYTNAGNVRVYRIRNGAVEVLSEEHTQAHRMVELGRMTPERAAEHPHRKKLTQFFGIMPEELTFNHPIYEDKAVAGDIYVLCSCGFYENITEERMAEISTSTDNVADFVKTVFSTVVSGGCREDITVLAIKAEGSDTLTAVGGAGSSSVSAHSVSAADDEPRRSSAKSAAGTAAVVAGAGVAAAGVAANAAEPTAPSYQRMTRTGPKTDVNEQKNDSVEGEIPVSPKRERVSPSSVETTAAAGTARRVNASSGKAEAVSNKSTKTAASKENSAAEDAAEKGGKFDAIKSFLGIGGDENTEQIWPALIVFIICLILVIVLTVYGVKIYNQNKDGGADATHNPYGTSDVTPVPTETSEGETAPAEATVEPSATDPSFVNTGSAETAETSVTETETPATEAPATEAPATEAPETEAPETAAPTTAAPTTAAPTTAAPTTAAPTPTPSTAAPTTAAPTPTPSPTPSTAEPITTTATTGGTTGGNTTGGENTGENTGDNTGDNVGDSTGDNTGDNAGDNTGDNAGDNTISGDTTGGDADVDSDDITTDVVA